MEKNKDYEMVNHPSHYNKYDVEVLEMMNRIWGPWEASVFCKLNAFKYRMRLGEKPDNPIEQDLEKEKFYLEREKFYKGKLNISYAEKDEFTENVEYEEC